MSNQDEKSGSLDLTLAICWIAGVILAIIVTLAFSGSKGPLAPVSDEILKWIGQILGPICLLVLSHVFGLNIVNQFTATLSRKKVFWLAFAMSLIFIGFAIGTIVAAAFVPDAGKDTPDARLRQLQTLSNSGTIILMVLIWPILSILLDYLFPKAEPSSSTPANPTQLSTPPQI